MSHSTASWSPEAPHRTLPLEPPPGARHGEHGRATPLFGAEALNSVAGTLLTIGLPFYTSHRFNWGARENFAVATCQGTLYVIGALSAQSISRRWGRKTSLLALYGAMTLFAIAVGLTSALGWALPTVALVAIETGLMGASWPMLESLVSAAGEPSQLSRRLGVYNIVWAAMGALALATSGAIIQHAPVWAFFGTIAGGHLMAGVLVSGSARDTETGTSVDSGAPEPSSHAESHVVRDPALASRHKLALWLSRIALPSTYVVVYSLAPALPSLHAIRQLSPTAATLVASVWFVARATTFVITGSTTFWHHRPSLVLWASIGMLFAFVGTVVPGALPDLGLPRALLAMAFAQTVLGFSIGLIYSASLYFGMAVSDGSTEHGGYHEALIGLGQVLGPMVGAIMQWTHPGALWPAVVAISVIISLTVVIEVVVSGRVAPQSR